MVTDTTLFAILKEAILFRTPIRDETVKKNIKNKIKRNTTASVRRGIESL
jgi:hypothetical protein